MFIEKEPAKAAEAKKMKEEAAREPVKDPKKREMAAGGFAEQSRKTSPRSLEEQKPRLPAAPEHKDPVSTLLEMLTPSTRMVYLPSPANPPGVLTSPQDVASLCRAFPATLFVVDEAYYEFAGITSAPLVQHLPNLAVTRPFSKCFGIAGRRVLRCQA